MQCPFFLVTTWRYGNVSALVGSHGEGSLCRRTPAVLKTVRKVTQNFQIRTINSGITVKTSATSSKFASSKIKSTIGGTHLPYKNDVHEGVRARCVAYHLRTTTASIRLLWFTLASPCPAISATSESWRHTTRCLTTIQ
jgi:hypothetical protein